MAEARRRVVLIHGAHRSRAGWWPVAAWLRRQGFDARPFGYRTRRETLDQHASRLAASLDRWWGPSRPEALGFLTHSMGALVARQYLALHGQAHAPRHRLVMLGPPNQGSSLAERMQGRALFEWTYGKAAQELRPQRVRAIGDLPPHVEALVLAGGFGARGLNPRLEGDDDGVVALNETPLEGAAHRRVGGVHSLLQWTPGILRDAAEFLGG